MNEHFFDGRGLSYRRNQFRPDRRALVFVHGVSGSSSAWFPYEARFESEYNILTYDLRGHGLSRKLQHYSDYAMPRFTQDLEALLAHLKIEKCVVIAHSFATLFTLDFLVRHSKCVEGAILLSPAVKIGGRLSEKIIRALLTPVPLLQYLPLSLKIKGRVDYVRYPQSGDTDFFALSRDVRNTSLRVYLYCTKQSFTADCTDVLPKLSMPVLIMHGTKDLILPFKGSAEMVEKIPHARLIPVERADHILVHNHVPKVSDAIVEFVASLSTHASMTGTPPKSSLVTSV